MVCGEDRRHALGSTKKEGLKIGSLLEIWWSGRASQIEDVHAIFPENERHNCRVYQCLADG